MSAKEVESVEAILEQHLPEGDLDAVKAILYGKPLKYRKTKTKKAFQQTTDFHC